jgi:hypothetical protein
VAWGTWETQSGMRRLRDTPAISRVFRRLNQVNQAMGTMLAAGQKRMSLILVGIPDR